MRLDDKFSNTRKMVDLVISDPKALKKINKTVNQRFFKNVDQVKQCSLNLKNIVLKKDLNTTTEVIHIEGVLPTL